MSKRMIATPKLVGKRLEDLKNQIKNIRETLYIVENKLESNVLLVKADASVKF